MTEGNNNTNVYVTAQSFQLLTEDIRKVNIKESYIHELGASGAGQQQELRPGDTVDGSRISSDTAVPSKNSSGQFGRSQSNEAPTGRGWISLTDKIFMNNKQPLKKRSSVYKGKQRFAGEWRDVAIKLIPYDEDNLEEIRFHLKLEDHPNIIRMYDADEIQGLTPQIYIVMELCKQTLKDYIEENRSQPFNFEQYFSFSKQIISGVAFIHKNKILHRDIKLENILISPSTENIRVADFGLSKQLQDGRSVATATARGLGTDGYRAPEMLHEDPKASFRSDSFSIGIVISMLFSNGQHPFGCDPARWRTNILDEKQPDLSAIQRFKKPYTQKRDQLLDLIKLALSPNPQDRPKPDEMLQHSFFKESSNTLNGNSGKMKGKSVSVVKILLDQAEKMFGEMKVLETSEIFYHLYAVEESDKLTVALKILTCEVYLNRGRIDESCQRLEDSILTFRPNAEVTHTSKKFSTENPYTRALGLVTRANQVRQAADDSPNEAATWICDVTFCISLIISYITDGNSKALNSDTKYGLEYMELFLLRHLRTLKNVSGDVRAIRESCVLNNIYLAFNDAGLKQKALGYAKEGIACLEKQFGQGAGKVKYYGMLLSNAGKSYYDIEKYSLAKSYFVRALDAFKVAESISDEERRSKISRNECFIKDYRVRLAK